mgnify:CR=1 FL=1
MCGQIIIEKLPDSVQRSAKRRVIYYPQGKGSDAESITTDSENKFCTKVKPGKYVVKVSLMFSNNKFCFYSKNVFGFWVHL